MAREFNTVTVLGTGVLGSQIAMQAAWNGKKVFAYDAFQEAVDNLPKRWEFIRQGYLQDLPDFNDELFNEAIARVIPTTDLAEAVGDTDIVIEAVPENLDLKKQTWEKVGALVADRALLATNTSSLLPSSFAESTGHPERFLAIHYANRVWLQNTAEIMGTAKTAPEALDDAVRYAEETGMVPLRVRKEVPGYFLNSLLIPWLRAASELFINGVGTPGEIDKAWQIATNSDLAPFAVYDTVGFNVASNIAMNSGQESQAKFAQWLRDSMAKGFSGRADGRGFYYYDAEGKRLGPVEDWNNLI